VILVTGATGFVGPKIVHALRAEGKPVRCLVRRPEAAAQLRTWGCELVKGDVTNPESVRRAVEGCDVVVHLVAIIVGSAEDFDRVMTRATNSLVAAAREAGVGRFVLMSALGTSEETKDLVPYYHAKWEMEQAVFCPDLEHVIFRPSLIFGRDGGVLPTFMRLVRYLPAIPVMGPGDTRLQPIWVDDVASFFCQAVELPAAANRTFELGGPDAVTWNELYDRIKSVLGKRRPKVHLPFGLMRVNAAMLEALPGPAPVTRDQLTMLQAGDNVADNGPALEVFDVDLVPLTEQLRRAA
jgi:NADH dehydrogenase